MSVILWSFTAILGDLISLPATSLVWWRVALTSLIMLCLPKVIHLLKRLGAKDLVRFLAIGVLVGLHWICFYGAIKLANASVALICLSTTTLFTSFIEPLTNRRSVSWLDVLFGVLVIPGIFLTTQGLSEGMMNGFWVGIISALMAALFAVYNKKYIDKSTPEVITTLEMIGAWLFLSVVVIVMSSTGYEFAFIPATSDWSLFFILAVLCTVVPYILHLRAYEHMTAFASNLVVNLEPVYGILLAFLILDDHKDLSVKFYVGVTLIFIVVMAYPYIKKRVGAREKVKS